MFATPNPLRDRLEQHGIELLVPDRRNFIRPPTEFFSGEVDFDGTDFSSVVQLKGVDESGAGPEQSPRTG